MQQDRFLEANMTAVASIRLVRDVMTARPVTVTPDLGVFGLHRLFVDKDLEACPVVGDDDILIGIVSRLDLLRMLRPKRDFAGLDVSDVASQQVKDIMRYGVVTVEPEDPLITAADLMVETRLHALPIVQRERSDRFVIGLLTQDQVLRALMPTEGRV
jgi:CBS domain-containing protein